MSAYAACHLWPPLKLGTLNISRGSSNILALNTVKTILFGFLRSAEFLSARGFVLAYLFVSCLSVQIGLSVLLWQQLCYIYQGNTYLSHLSSQGSDAVVQRDCQNIAQFFGCSHSALRYLPRFQNPRKRHKKWTYNRGNFSLSERSSTFCLFLFFQRDYFCCFGSLFLRSCFVWSMLL